MAQGTTKGVPIDKDPLLNLDSDLVVPSQKAIKAYVDAKKSAADSDYINVSGDVMTGFLTLNADPTINLHAATKQYVDNYINGLDYKAAAHVGTKAALSAYTVSVNKLVLTKTSNGAIPTATFDGHDPTIGQRVLIKDEVGSLAPNNGIYILTQVGDASNPFILTRADDANTSAKLGEATLSIINGDTLSNTIWHCSPASPTIVIGSTNLTFIELGSGSVGTGIENELTYWSSSTSLGSLTGNITTTKKFLSQIGNGTITSSPTWEVLTKTDVGLTNVENTALSTWVGSTSITTLGTISSGTWNGGIIPGQYGGTGVANTGKTITVSGNTTIGSSTHTVAFTTSANTSLALPSSGTVISTVTNMLNNPVTGTPSGSNFLRGDGTWAAGVGTGSVATGQVRRLALYTSAGTGLGDAFTQNSTFTTNILLGTATLTASNTLTIPVTNADASFIMSVGSHSTGALTLNAAGSATTAQLTFGGGTNNWINFGLNGVNIPVLGVSTRSIGTKIVLYNSLTSTVLDNAIGYSSGGTWISLATSTESFILYAPISSAVTNVFSVSGTGSMTMRGGTIIMSTNTIAGNVTGSADTGIISRNFINLGNGGGVGIPAAVGSSWGTRSLGSRVIIQATSTTTQADMAIGYNTNEMWMSLFTNTSGTSFGWYGAATKIMTLRGDGLLTLTAAIVGTASQDVFNTVSTTVNFAGAAAALTIGATTGTMTLRNPNIVGTQATQNLFHTSASTTVSLATSATTINIADYLVNSTTTPPINQTVNIANPTSFSFITSNITRNINIGNGAITSQSGFTTTQNINIGFHGTISSSSGAMTTVITLGGNTRISHPVGGTGSQATQLCFFGGSNGNGGPVVRQTCAGSTLAELYTALRAYGLIT
jgi:hypothetical protein